ncbi:sugar phosphate isomerase/epimerase family protein [Microbacterium marinilacus]|uniref:Sugar phosphate isomerase/epimerase n=1 Tax=Microbacterium marinilacus TaxID=415209 RepID=A0ABP7BR02_9MICO|nr:sugar phosphate isomerase/epimerase family protein [Microbacterium marinilacus]MBY0689245.1 sugar phosphate isomerase/epimerase [Microbacterium marinilacus]
MRFGAHSQMFVHDIREDVDGVFDAVAGFGLAAIEINTPDAAVFPLDEVRRAAERTGLEVVIGTALGAERSTIADDEAARRRGIEHLRGCVEIAAALGGHRVSGGVHSANGAFHGRGRSPEEWERSVAALREVAPDAEAADVTLTVEPVSRYSGYFLNTADDTVRLVDQVGSSHVRVQLDTFHMNIEEDDTPAAIRRVGDRLAHFHAVENNRGVPGTGQVPWRDVFAALRDVGYDGLIVFEHFPVELRDMAVRTHTWRHIASSAEVCSRAPRLLEELAR